MPALPSYSVGDWTLTVTCDPRGDPKASVLTHLATQTLEQNVPFYMSEQFLQCWNTHYISWVWTLRTICYQTKQSLHQQFVKQLIVLWIIWGWSGGAKVLCILHHRGVQLILAYSWARPAILVVGKGRGGMFLFLLFLHFHSCSSFFPCPSLSSPLLSSISFLPFSGRRHKMTLKGWRVVKPQHNQSNVNNIISKDQSLENQFV